MTRFSSKNDAVKVELRTLRAEDLASAWVYVRMHCEEIDREIAENAAT